VWASDTNIPRDKKEALSIKQMFCAPEGFYLGEADGDKRKLEIQRIYLETKILLMLLNQIKISMQLTSTVFRIPYNQIVSENGEVLNKDIRELSKESTMEVTITLQAGKSLLISLGSNLF